MNAKSIHNASDPGTAKSQPAPFFGKNGRNGTPFFSPRPQVPVVQRKQHEDIPEDLRANIEGFFNQDFFDVAIQKNSQEAVGLHARAFARGNSIHFAPGEFNPQTEQGKNLIGHEFAHVAQQRRGVVRPTSVLAKGLAVNDDSRLESEADQLGKLAVSGASMPLHLPSMAGAEDNMGRTSANSSVVQRVEYTGQDHGSSVRHLMRILDDGNVDCIRVAVHALQRAAASANPDTEEAVRVAFTSLGDTYDLAVSVGEIDHFVRMYERYLASQAQAVVTDDFVTAFNTQFSSILHIFSPAPGSELVGEESSSLALDAAAIERYFTPGQINALQAYFDTRIIPERLFNGDEANRLDAGVRIVMSGHILANGRYHSGFRTQEVHARMCGHWVEVVHQYAGAAPASRTDGAFHEGVMGTTDHSGQIVLGAGRSGGRARGERFDRDALEVKERRVSRSLRLREASEELARARRNADLVRKETEGNPSRRRQIAEADRLLRQAELNHRNLTRISNVDFIRFQAISLDDVRGLQGGDWLYLYNDNDSRSGEHSVIFSHWISWVELPDGRAYGQAALFSQRSPTEGGRAHPNWIGNFTGTVDGRNVQAVTFWRRPDSSSNPATSADEILPPLAPQALARAEADNNGFIVRQRLDRAAVMDALREQNRSLLDALAWRLTRNQRALLIEINEADNLERRVQLNERLRNLHVNVETTEAGRERAIDRARQNYEPQLARRREAVKRLMQGLKDRFDRADELLQAFATAMNSRPDGVVPNRRSTRHRMPTELVAGTYASAIGFTDAQEAVEALDGLLQRETVTPEQADEESAHIDGLARLFTTLSGNIPGAREHFRRLRRSTRQRNNDVNPPSTRADRIDWENRCSDAHGPLNRAFAQLNNSLLHFARNLRRQGGALPFVTTHIGSRGERFSPTGRLSSVPGIAE